MVWLPVAAVVVWTAVATAQGQDGTWSVPRTAFGQPDLQGVWDFASITPLERPANLAGRETLTQEEVAERFQANSDRLFDRGGRRRASGQRRRDHVRGPGVGD